MSGMEEQNIKGQNIIDSVFSSSDKRLYALLGRRDETGCLPKMLYGVVMALNNSQNPMRF